VTNALYDPLLERDLDAIAPAARAFADEHSLEELWIAVARFAVLAYAPSQHGKRTVMAVRAAHDLLVEDRQSCLSGQAGLPVLHSFDWIVECARYAAESRPPWSEPPIFEERELPSWDELRANARGDALLMLDTAIAIEQLLGGKGRAALVRMVTSEPESEHPSEPLEVLLDRAIDSKGAVDAVRAVFIAAVGLPVIRDMVPLEPYHLARDYAQTLIAHSVARTLPLRAEEFLGAVHHNLEFGESYAEWAFA
jgi:hypothetical protein